MVSVRSLRGAAFGAAALAAAGVANASTVALDFGVDSQTNTGISTGGTISCSASDAVVTQVLTSGNTGSLSAAGSFACFANGDEVAGFDEIVFDLTDSPTIDFALFQASNVSFFGAPGSLSGSFVGFDAFENAGLSVADIGDFNSLNTLLAAGNTVYTISNSAQFASGPLSSTSQVSAVPLPGGILLLPVGVAALVLAGRRNAGRGDVFADVNAAYENAQDGAVAHSFNKAVIVIVQSGKVNLGAFATNVVYANLDTIANLQYETQAKDESSPAAAPAPIAA